MLFHQPHNSGGSHSYNAYLYDDLHYTPHFHRNFEIIYVYEGSLACTIGDKSDVLEKGDFALVLSNEIHSLEQRQPGKSWVGVYSGDFIHAFEKKAAGMIGSQIKFRCAPSVETFLQENLLKEEQPPVYMIKACLYAICAEYDRQVRLMPRQDKRGVLMNAITDYISANFREKITLSAMAEDLGYNYYYLSKCFHRIFDMSFSDYINMYRLDTALAMLTETDKDIIDIALESGFQSIRSFNDYFLSRTGITPTKYRQQMK